MARPQRTGESFATALVPLLSQAGLSMRALATELGLNVSHISQITGASTRRTVSPDLARRVARVLDLPEDYFPEVREAAVIAAVQADGSLRDRIYDRLPKRPSAGRRLS